MGRDSDQLDRSLSFYTNIMVGRKPYACELAAYTDEELDHYLAENGRVVSVQDPKNVSAEFIQRLRDWLQRERDATISRPVDLDQVAAQLEAVSDSRRFSRSPSLATTAPPPSQEELDRENLRDEKQYYQELVDAGGRPPYPFHLLEDFLWYPDQYLEHEQYRDVVNFWRKKVHNKEERTLFCGCHLSHWEGFRKLQRIIRDRSVVDEYTLVYASSWDSWESFVDRFGSKDGQWGFSEYSEKMKARLTKYGFTRLFKLDHDPDQQDKLTTWIEYLGYEYYFYDQAATYVKRFQQRHDNAWNRLVSSDVLAQDETYDVICNVRTQFQYANEEERAENAEMFAKAAVSSIENATAETQCPRKLLQKRLVASRTALDTATETHRKLSVRNEAVSEFLSSIRRFRNERDKADDYRCLLRWIQQQIPLIESEQNSSSHDVGTDPDRTSGNRKLKRARAAEHNESQQSPKRKRTGSDTYKSLTVSPSSSREVERPSRRLEGNDLSSLASNTKSGTTASLTSALIPDTEMTQDPKGENTSHIESSRSMRPVRRSARIATKRKESAMIVPTAKPSSRLAEDQYKVKSASAKMKRPKRTSLRSTAKPRGVKKRAKR